MPPARRGAGGFAPGGISPARRGLRTRVARAAIVAAILYAALVAWSMARVPQLYASSWYALGGWRRTVQVVVTDTLGPNGVVVAALLLLLVAVRPVRLRRVRQAVVPAAAIVVLRWASEREAQAELPAGRPNVLVLAVDSLRADRLDPRIAPNLGRLAERGTRFDRAYVSSPSGLPPWAGLPARFASAGYATATVSEAFVAGDSRIGRALFPPRIEDGVAAKLRALQKQPFYLTVALSTPRAPYAAPAPYYAKYTDPAYRGRFKYDAPKGGGAVDDADARQIGALYDGTVAAVDDAVGEILAALDRLDLTRRTIVVVTSNHGERLVDDGRSELVGDDVMHVPLVIVDPSQGRGRVSAVVRDVDIAPTLCELAGVPAERDGRSLVPALRGEPLAPALAYAETRAPTFARARTLRDDRYKLVYVPTRTSVQWSLFDTVGDPDETNDVAAAHPNERARLEAALWAHVLADPSLEQRAGYVVPKEPPVPYNVLWIAQDRLDPTGLSGVHFPHAYSVATTAAAGQLALLAGARATELGLDASGSGALSDPPLIALTLQRRGMATAAFGELPARLALGFDRSIPSRTPLEAAARWIEANKTSRFFAYVNGPRSEGVGALLRTLDGAGIRERTIVVVTAERGASQGRDGHEAAIRVPMVIAAPNLPPGDVAARVRTIDLAPTVLELLDVEPHARTSGRSLLALAKGHLEPEERSIVSEGSESRALLRDRWHLIVRAHASELYDLVDDPNEQRDLAASRPDVVAEMRARLEAALDGVAVAGSAPADAKPLALQLRFAGAPARRVAGTITIGDARSKVKTYDVRPVVLGRDAFHRAAEKIEIAFRTSPIASVGFDIVVDPPSAPVRWELWLDDQPWPENAIFGGPFGLPSRALQRGMTTEDARREAHGTAFPEIDPLRDLGLFVVRGRMDEDATRVKSTP